MPEYLAPGVYVEETSYRSKSIEGVSTTTTAFLGPTHYGPIDSQPPLLTSLADFERLYGDGSKLQFSDGEMNNYMWQAVRAFFEEGGQRLYVARVFKSNGNDTGFANKSLAAAPEGEGGTATTKKTAKKKGGAAAGAAVAAQQQTSAITVQARYPGANGNLLVHLTLQRGQNVLGGERGSPTVASLRNRDTVLIVSGAQSVLAVAVFDEQSQTWKFEHGTGTIDLTQLNPDGHELRIVTLSIAVSPANNQGLTAVWSNIPLDSQHETNGTPDSLNAMFGENPTSPSQAQSLPIVIKNLEGMGGVEVYNQIKGTIGAQQSTQGSANLWELPLLLSGGNDGARPDAGGYSGDTSASTNPEAKAGLKLLEDLEEVSIIAAPGATYGYNSGYGSNAATIIGALIAHAEKMKYRVAVLDAGNGQTLSQIQNLRARLDSTYAALYYPWIQILDPITQKEISVPPSGALAGIYARNDTTRAVYKAPANEVVRTAVGFESTINRAQQEVLNPEGINCLRFFENRGYRVWGARTISSDPEWKYVNVRRYLCYLEHSIERGTQWAVFEPNGEALWENVRSTISDFLFNEFKMGALLGETPVQAYFVRCDRSTMTQNDVDNGRLVCLIGVAVLRPAEFVIFRVGQWTADSQS